MNETWLPAVGWGGYEVSIEGRVRSIARTVSRRDGTTQRFRGRELRPFRNSEGYWVVRLSMPGKRAVERVHRIVATAFVAPGHTTETVNHKDGNKSNNRADNLEWATRSENTKHSIANGLGNYVPPLRKRPPHPQPETRR
jgi:hypothetical protein